MDVGELDRLCKQWGTPIRLVGTKTFLKNMYGVTDEDIENGSFHGHEIFVASYIPDQTDDVHGYVVSIKNK